MDCGFKANFQERHFHRWILKRASFSESDTTNWLKKYTFFSLTVDLHRNTSLCVESMHARRRRRPETWSVCEKAAEENQ